MSFDWLINPIIYTVTTYQTHLIASGIVVGIYLLLTRLVLPKIERGVDRSRFKPESANKAHHTVKWIGGFVACAALLLIWGIDFNGLLVVSTTVITLTGVALFANWSILSNITAFFVLLMHPSYRRGNFIRVIDGDNYIEAYISEINLFNAALITEDREIMVYPNNLLLGRPAIINPRKRFRVAGKLTDFQVSGEESQLVLPPEPPGDR